MKVKLPNVPLWVGMAGAWSQLLGAGGLGPGGTYGAGGVGDASGDDVGVCVA